MFIWFLALSSPPRRRFTRDGVVRLAGARGVYRDATPRQGSHAMESVLTIYRGLSRRIRGRRRRNQPRARQGRQPRDAARAEPRRVRMARVTGAPRRVRVHPPRTRGRAHHATPDRRRVGERDPPGRDRGCHRHGEPPRRLHRLRRHHVRGGSPGALQSREVRLAGRRRVRRHGRLHRIRHEAQESNRERRGERRAATRARTATQHRLSHGDASRSRG